MENDEIEIIKIKDQLLADISSGLHAVVSGGESTKLPKLLNSIQQFQPSPQLLDKHLGTLTSSLCNAYDLKSEKVHNSVIGEIFYQLTKVRGYKAISNCLSSDVYLIEPILHKFESELPWKENFFLLLWLSIVILNPFQLSSIDPGLAQTVYNLSLRFSVNNSKEADAASILMSRLLSRPDNEQLLENFYGEIRNSFSNEYLALSYLSTMNNVLKIGKLASLTKVFSAHLQFVKKNLATKNLNILKACIKNLGKLGELAVVLDDVDTLEEIINFLIAKLDYSSTIIRYCVSRQIAKICIKLDAEFQEDLISTILNDLEIPFYVDSEFNSELKIDPELININKYHGVLLTLAELLNAKVIRHDILPGIVSILHKALFIEQNRLTYAVGSNVRDASCYVSWSLMRRYRGIDSAILKALFEDLLLVCLFDKEIMVRRSASAVTQELIGRFGDEVYPQYSNWKLEQPLFKLKVIEILDFVVLGDMKKAFALSKVIVQELNGAFKSLFTFHLYALSFSNDYEVRRLSIDHLVQLIDVGEVDALVTKILSQPPRPGSFYLLAELIKLHPVHIDAIMLALSKQEFNSHKDNHSKGEELLYIISSILPFKESCFEDNSGLIFNIIRVSRSAEIAEKFLLVIQNLSTISDKTFEKLIYNVKMGNNLAVANSFRVFIHLSPSQLNDIMRVIEDQTQDSDVRSALIESLSAYFNRHPFPDVARIITQLDDYTITSQGDVGSKLRLSVIHFIACNLVRLSENQDMIKFINTKLVRLNFDMIDRVRTESFSLFSKTFNVREISAVEDDYFGTLLNMYNSLILSERNPYLDLLSQEFMKGFSFLSGGVISSNKLIQDSLHALLHHLERSEDFVKLKVLNTLSSILSKNAELSISAEQCQLLGIQLDFQALRSKNNERLFKLQTSTLTLFQRFFELNFRFPEAFDFRSLFVKVFNLQLNQLSRVRLKACFAIFKHMYLQNQQDEFMSKGKTRLVQLLCTSKSDRVRLMCSEVLFELYFESEGDNDVYLKKLESVSWGRKGDFASYLRFFK